MVRPNWRAFSRPALSGGVRLLGAVLTFAAAAVGIRMIGVDQFGVSVLALAAGQLVAFPLTALERLMVRLYGEGRHEAVWRIDRRATTIVGGLLGTTLVLGPLVWWISGRSASVFVLATGVTAACAALLVVRGAYARCIGQLWWGQVPAELVRPSLALGALAAVTAFPLDVRGSAATLIASGLSLAVIAFAPRPSHPATQDAADDPGPRLHRAVASLVVISAVAVLMERGLPLAIGARTGAAQVAVFAVGLRIVQLSNFGQAFAIFYFSPPLASALAEGDGRRIGRLSAAIRTLGLAVAVPVALVVGLVPVILDRAFGLEGTLADLRVPIMVAVLAVALAGPSQNALILSGHELVVALIYGTGLLVGIITFGLLDGDAFGGLTASAAASCWWTLGLLAAARHRLARWL